MSNEQPPARVIRGHSTTTKSLELTQRGMCATLSPGERAGVRGKETSSHDTARHFSQAQSLGTERGCVGDQPQRVGGSKAPGARRVLRLVEDDTAALRIFAHQAFQTWLGRVLISAMALRVSMMHGAQLARSS